MGLFFSFLYVDTRRLNYVEGLLEQSVAQLPFGTRVVSALCDQRGDVNLVGHTHSTVHASGVVSVTPTTNLRVKRSACK